MPSLNVDELVNFNRFNEFSNKLAASDTLEVDNPPTFDSVKYFFTGKNAITDRVESILQGRIRHLIKLKDPSFQSEPSIKLVAETVLIDCGLTRSNLCDINSVKKIFAKLDNPNFLHSVANDNEIFDLAPSQGKSIKATAENAIKVLMGGDLRSINISLELLKGVVWEENRELLEGFLEALQEKINEVSTQLQNGGNEEIFVAVLGNLLALVPFAEPKPGKTLTIPQKIDGNWTKVDYTTETLLLTPKKYGSQVPAIGLKPLNNDDAEPLLLFRGTPQPSASGSLPATFSDIIPFYSVGEYIYEEYSKDLIQNWINASGKKVKLFGQSLGGSLSLIALVNQPDKISEVYVYGSPSLLKSTMAKYEANLAMKEVKEKARVHLFWNNKDMVPLTGHGFHKDWQLHKVIIPENQDFVRSHALIHTAFKNVIVVNVDPEVDSKTTIRKVMVLFHHIMSCLLLPFIILAMFCLTLFVKLRKFRATVQDRFNENDFTLTSFGDASLVQAKISA